MPPLLLAPQISERSRPSLCTCPAVPSPGPAAVSVTVRVEHRHLRNEVTSSSLPPFLGVRHRLDAVVCGSHCPWPARGPGREAPSFAQETVYTQRADLSSFSAHPAGPRLVAERPCLSPPSGSPAFLAQPRLSLWNVSWWHRPPPGVHKGTGVFVRADPPPHAEPDAARAQAQDLVFCTTIPFLTPRQCSTNNC